MARLTKILKKELKTTSASFMRSHIEALLSHHLRELERICIIIYLDNSQNLLSWNYIFCMDVRIIINFNTWIWIFNKLKLKMRPSISIEEPTVSFKKLFHCHSIWILNKFKLWGFVRKQVSPFTSIERPTVSFKNNLFFDIINVLYVYLWYQGLKHFHISQE